MFKKEGEKTMIQLDAIFEGHRSLKDGSLKLTFETQDLIIAKDDITEILSLTGQFGKLAFKMGETPLENEEVETPKVDIPKPAKDEKSPSSKLRDVIFIYWQKLGSKGKFDTFYSEQMEKVRKRYLGAIQDD